MVETEEEERDIILDANNVTMDNFCQSPVTANTKGENVNAIFTSERRNILEMLAETLKGLTLDSTINDSAYYNSDEYDAEGDPKIDPLLATHISDGKKRKVTDTDTTNGNPPQKLLINQTLLMIILPIDPRVEDGVPAGRGNTYARQTPASKVIVTDTARRGAHVFWTPGDVSWTDRDGTTPWYRNTTMISHRFN